MTMIYGGEKCDPMYEGDELSALISKKLFKSVKHRYSDKNTVIVKF